MRYVPFVLLLVAVTVTLVGCHVGAGLAVG